MGTPQNGEARQAVTDAACFECGQQMTSYQINAFHVKLTNTRRAKCVGSLVRSFFTFLSQLTPAIARETDQMPQRA